MSHSMVSIETKYPNNGEASSCLIGGFMEAQAILSSSCDSCAHKSPSEANTSLSCGFRPAYEMVNKTKLILHTLFSKNFNQKANCGRLYY